MKDKKITTNQSSLFQYWLSSLLHKKERNHKKEKERERSSQLKEQRQKRKKKKKFEDMEIDYRNQQRHEETFRQWRISQPGSKAMASAGFIFTGKLLFFFTIYSITSNYSQWINFMTTTFQGVK